MAQPIPTGHHTITPHLTVKGASEAIEFYKRAFGAEEISRLPVPNPDGQEKLGHAALRIDDSRLFLADECPEFDAMGPTGNPPMTMHLYVTDADAAFDRAVKAGATVRMSLADMFWGDRYGLVVDPFGHNWSIATRKEDLTPDQMRERMAAAFRKPVSASA